LAGVDDERNGELNRAVLGRLGGIFLRNQTGMIATLPQILLLVLLMKVCAAEESNGRGSAYTLLNKLNTECELEALNVGTRLADRYNMYDEQTEWDTRIHNDYLVQHLGFAGWIQMGTWKNTHLTAEKQDAPALHRVCNYLSSLSATRFITKVMFLVHHNFCNL
jgi:hypothetical protein